ncbi:hypothetical protein NC656_03400, partial [Pseudomonas asiatica]|uniref:hypothetical protein n=1 Tax=Pseudomonas asiatica TaxID=2219225 RepID=UPI00209C21D2
MLDQLANGVFHGDLFSTASAVERLDAQVEKLGIIRGWGRVANLWGATIKGSMLCSRASSPASQLPQKSARNLWELA